jgi:hypothetical protein
MRQTLAAVLALLSLVSSQSLAWGQTPQPGQTTVELIDERDELVGPPATLETLLAARAAKVSKPVPVAEEDEQEASDLSEEKKTDDGCEGDDCDADSCVDGDGADAECAGGGLGCDEVFVGDGYDPSSGRDWMELEFGPGLTKLMDSITAWIGRGSAYGNAWYAFESAKTYWGRMDYLSWDAKGDRLPALVTTSSPGTPQSQMGVLGQPNTTILFGDGRVNDSSRPGVRTTFGYGMFDGWQADYMALETAVTQFSQSSIGTPILARPFFDVVANAPNASIVAAPSVTVAGFPGVNLRGSVTATDSSKVQSAGFGIRKLLWLDTWQPFRGYFRLQGIAGYRWFSLEEQLSISESVFPVGTPFVLGSHTDRTDVFRTNNQFHGGEFGFITALHQNRWSFEWRSKLAIGNMRQVVERTGWSTVSDTINTSTTDTGLLVQATNRGRNVVDEFCLIPEIGFDIGLQLTPQWKANVGYTLVYVSQAAQPGEFVDPAINRVLAGGGVSTAGARPAYVSQDTDFYAHGISAGFEFKF